MNREQADRGVVARSGTVSRLAVPAVGGALDADGHRRLRCTVSLYLDER